MPFKEPCECEFLHVLSEKFSEVPVPESVSEKYALTVPDSDLYMIFLDKMSICMDENPVFFILEKDGEGRPVLQVLCPASSTEKELQEIDTTVRKWLETVAHDVESEMKPHKKSGLRC